VTSKLVQERLHQHKLLPLLEMRERGGVPSSPEAIEAIGRAEILTLGAAADLVRRRECGDEVRVYVPFAPSAGDSLVIIGPETSARGTALLRHIASRRLLGPIGQRIVVDFGAFGLEIAQVALNFGATDLSGVIASRRGLPMLESDEPKKLLKRREIAGLIERAGFRPMFVTTEARPESRSQPDDTAARAHADS